MGNVVDAQSSEFEGAGTGAFIPWFGCSISKSTTAARNGTGSLLVASDGQFAGVTLNNYPGFPGVVAGADYAISYSGQGPASTWTLAVRWKDASGGDAGSSDVPLTLVGAGIWVDVAPATFTAPAGAAYAYFEFSTSDGSAADFHFDSFVVTDELGGGSTAIAVDGARSAARVTSPTLTQNHALAVGGAGAAAEATSPLLAQRHGLAVHDASSSTGATSPLLSTGLAESSTYVARGLTPDSRYRARVRATNTAGASAWSDWVDFQTLPAPSVVHVLHLNGPEYGLNDPTAPTSTFSNANLGTYDTDYHYDGQSTLDYLAGRGWRRVKLPLRWERVQPTISGALDPTEMGRLTGFLDRAATAGLDVIVDIHNYGVYYRDVSGTGTRTPIGAAALPVAAFADLWSRLAGALVDHPALHAYAIMAEPQSGGGLDRATWQSASQAAVDAIRAVDTAHEVHVAGWDYSITQGWATVNPSPWITDPTGLFRYEGHHYWDANTSGGYADSYAVEVTAASADYSAGAYADALHARILTELDEFHDWLAANGVQGIVGEIGWPGAADTAAWNALAEVYLNRCAVHGLPTATWCAGEFAFGGTADLRVYTGSPVDTPNPQAAVLEAHL